MGPPGYVHLKIVGTWNCASPHLYYAKCSLTVNGLLTSNLKYKFCSATKKRSWSVDPNRYIRPFTHSYVKMKQQTLMNIKFAEN